MLEYIITAGVIVIAISCLSIEANLRGSIIRDKEIISLLKEIAQKKWKVHTTLQ